MHAVEQVDICGFNWESEGEPAFDQNKSQQVKQKVYTLVRSFELPAYPFIVRMQGSGEKM